VQKTQVPETFCQVAFHCDIHRENVSDSLLSALSSVAFISIKLSTVIFCLITF
jgi:hypothetical protein